MNYFHQCREVTIEISATKTPNGNQLPNFWGYLRRSLLNYMEESLYGVRGMVTDANTGQPLAAEIYVLNHEADSSWVYSSPAGDYHRLLIAGTYNIRYSFPCYQTQIFNNVVVQNETPTILNVQLIPNAADFTANTTNIIVGNTVEFTDISCGNPTSWLWVVTGPGTVTYVNGTSNTSQNPVVQFDNAGVYSVMLTVSGPAGTFSLTKSNYISVTNCTVSNFPWSEGFENAGNIPNCWSQEYVTNTLDWTYQNGGQSGHPISAHSGSYNAFLYYANTTSRVTKLITPQINLSVLINPVLTFWHTQALWSPDQDELRIFYKTSLSGTWTLLQTFTNNITAWTLESINLPNPSSEYYIAFQGTAKYGYGVCLDDITVNGTVILPPVAGFSASTTSPLVGETVTFADQSTNEPTSWSWTFTPSTVTYMGGTNSNSQNPQVQFNEPVNYTVELVATNSAGSDSEIKTDYISVQSPDFDLNLKVMLEGPFNGFSMNTDLTGLTDFPMTQPYQSAPWNYSGTESISVIPPDVVDWVLVELRDANDAVSATESTRIARQAGFVLSDGTVVGMDGSSSLSFSNSVNQQLFVVIYHRNHLPVMSAVPLIKSSNIYSYDFSIGASQAYGTDSEKLLTGGVYGMYSGDANADGIIDDNDKTNSWNSETGLSGYLSSDLNLDGQSDNGDKNEIWLPNQGIGSQIP